MRSLFLWEFRVSFPWKRPACFPTCCVYFRCVAMLHCIKCIYICFYSFCCSFSVPLNYCVALWTFKKNSDQLKMTGPIIEHIPIFFFQKDRELDREKHTEIFLTCFTLMSGSKSKSEGTAFSFSTRLLHSLLKHSLVKCCEQMLLYLVGLKLFLLIAATHLPQMSGRARGNLMEQWQQHSWLRFNSILTVFFFYLQNVVVSSFVWHIDERH